MIISLAFSGLLSGQTDTISLSSGTAAAGGTVTLNLSLSSPAGNEPAAIQWSLGYPTSSITAINTAVAGMATSVENHLLLPMSSLVHGMLSGNNNVIPNGLIASVTSHCTRGPSASIGISNASGLRRQVMP
jgi:hypothetical protein